jgi:hypothetical protein
MVRLWQCRLVAHLRSVLAVVAAKVKTHSHQAEKEDTPTPRLRTASPPAAPPDPTVADACEKLETSTNRQNDMHSANSSNSQSKPLNQRMQALFTHEARHTEMETAFGRPASNDKPLPKISDGERSLV